MTHEPTRIPPEECEILDHTLADLAGSPAWLGIAWRPKDPKHPYNTTLTQALEDYERNRQQTILNRYLENLPTRYRNYTLDNLRRHPGNQTAVHTAADLQLGENLYIWGPAGNGKTHLAAATGRRLATQGHTVRFWGVVELFNTLRASFGSGAARPNLDQPEILILDDLGKIKPTDFVYEVFYGTLEHRWANEKTTIFTANHRPSHAARHMTSDPESAAAILSRMASGTVTEITGPDRRLPT